MKIRFVVLIVATALLSMIGLIVIQITWIKDAYEKRKNSFDQAVYSSLSESLSEYEKFATLSFFENHSEYKNNFKKEEQLKKIQNEEGDLDFLYTLEDTSSEFYKSVITELNMPKKLIDQIGPTEREKLQQHFIEFNDKWRNQARLMLYESICVDEKINPDTLRSFIFKSLNEHQIKSNFKLTILDGATKGIIYTDYKALNKNIIDNSYKSRIFPESIFNNYAILLINFPEKNKDIWENMYASFIATAVFILLIVLTFFATVYTIFQQKKLSDMKTDFVNNMTHELKTPVATIGLASNMLQNPKVQQNPEKLKKYADMIQEENNRLLSNIEKVLQAAKLKKSRIKLKITKVNIHEILKEKAENTRLLLEESGGSVELELLAHYPEIEADQTHVENILNNLVENAIKYQKEHEPLKLKISTHNVENGIDISIEDNGIGMPNEVLHRIFEKFYRVPTGNVHNVKGFGLGLNYVKELTEAHFGKVWVTSKLGKGSVFTISLPIYYKGD